MALARAHARSGDPAVLTGYMGKSAAFEDALADFSVAYADQNERDYAALWYLFLRRAAVWRISNICTTE